MKVSVAEAAAQRGVSAARVRAMIAAGRLDAVQVGGRWLVEVASMPSTPGRAGQPYTARNAWALMWLAEGDKNSDLSSPEASRLRARWRKLQDEPNPVAVLRSVLARRGRRVRLSAPEPDGVLDDPRVVRSGRSDIRSGMSVRDYAEAYVPERHLEELELDHFLVPAEGAENVLLRAVPDDVRLAPRTHAPVLAVICDLADGGPREQQQARILWDRLVVT